MRYFDDMPWWIPLALATVIFGACVCPCPAQTAATDVIQDDLIDAPDSVVRIQDLITETITIKLPPNIPYEILPEPENDFTFIDEKSGKRIVFIHNGMPPGYTVTINHAVVHPTEEELAGAPTVPDPKDLNQVKAFKDYLRKHSKDEIYRDTHFIRVGSPTPPPPPPPGDLTETEKKVRDWARVVGNKTEVQLLANAYAGIIAKIDNEDYDKLTFPEASKQILSDMFNAGEKVVNDPSWESVRQNLRVMTNEIQAKGDLDSVQKIRALFKQIQTGLEASLK